VGHGVTAGSEVHLFDAQRRCAIPLDEADDERRPRVRRPVGTARHDDDPAGQRRTEGVAHAQRAHGVAGVVDQDHERQHRVPQRTGWVTGADPP
jgi:hypothetical protein